MGEQFCRKEREINLFLFIRPMDYSILFHLVYISSWGSNLNSVALEKVSSLCVAETLSWRGSDRDDVAHMSQWVISVLLRNDKCPCNCHTCDYKGNLLLCHSHFFIFFKVVFIFLFFLEVVFIFLIFLRSSSFFYFFWGRLHFSFFFEVVFIFFHFFWGRLHFHFFWGRLHFFFWGRLSFFFWGRLSSWVKIRLHAENQPPRLSGSALKV